MFVVHTVGSPKLREFVNQCESFLGLVEPSTISVLIAETNQNPQYKSRDLPKVCCRLGEARVVFLLFDK